MMNEKLSNIDIDKIANDVFVSLDFLDVEDLWHDSGATRYGYNDPGDVAHEMVERALEDFVKKLRKYRELKLFDEEKLYCMGILKGIRDYLNNSESEFKDWASDSPGIFFEDILDEWKENCEIPEYFREMDEYLNNGGVEK